MPIKFKQSQAEAVCKAYNSKVATLTQLEEAYQKGADWCSYGWREGQKAFYPVQKCNLNTDNNQENNDFLENSDKYCGKPGMNGGYFSNPQLKFGINCYGVKPKGSVVKEKSPYCAPKEFCKLNKNINSSHKLSTDEISPFNNTKWNI